jgi:pimeloyl-ACP methyl ester carboxylesterase
MMVTNSLLLIASLALPGAPADIPRPAPALPACTKTRVFFNGESLHAVYLVIDARTAGEREDDRSAGRLKGPVVVFFQGHGQRPPDAYQFTSLVARLSTSGVVVVPVCDTPYGTDKAWRGDDGKDVVLMEVVRHALASLGVSVRGYAPRQAVPVLVDGSPVDDASCPADAGLLVLGWSHGGILARRFAHAYPESVSALGQVCPAGYERMSPAKLVARFTYESLRIARITAGTNTMDTFRSGMGLMKGLTGDTLRSFADAVVSGSPSVTMRAARDIKDCALYCDSTILGSGHLARISVAFGEGDTCMSPVRILGIRQRTDLTEDMAAGFWKKYYSDAAAGQASLRLNVLPGTHLAPVTHSELYARTILGDLGELASPL